MLKGEVKDVLLLDVTPLSLGIETKGGVFTKLIERNTTIPTKKSETSRRPRTTSRRSRSTCSRASRRWPRYNKTLGKFQLVGIPPAPRGMPQIEVTFDIVAFNKTLGKFQLVGIPPAPRGMPQIEVTFDIDANGIINVSAKDLGTGNEQQIQIEGGSGLNEDEVERMIKEAEAHGDEAHKLRELADARNLAETLAYQTENTLKEHRDKLDESEASTIEGRIMELKAVLESSDVNEIKAKTEALQEASHKLAEAVYAQATAAQAGSATGGNGASAPRRRGRRGRRLRGHRRRRGGEEVVMADEQPKDNPEETLQQSVAKSESRPKRSSSRRCATRTRS